MRIQCRPCQPYPLARTGGQPGINIMPLHMVQVDLIGKGPFAG